MNVGYNNTMIWRPSYIDIVFHMHNYCMAQIEVSRARGCKKEEGYIIIHNLTNSNNYYMYMVSVDVVAHCPYFMCS